MNKIINKCIELISSFDGLDKKALRLAILKEIEKAPYNQRTYIFMIVQKELQKAHIIL